jgi:hypothetical protein
MDELLQQTDMWEVLKELRELQEKKTSEYDSNCDDYWNSLPYDEKNKAFYSVVKRLVKGELKDRGSYRHVLYDVFEFGPESYGIAIDCGFLALHNSINEIKTYEALYNFVHFVANDYVELSHDKVRWQRDDFIKRARKLLAELDN